MDLPTRSAGEGPSESDRDAAFISLTVQLRPSDVTLETWIKMGHTLCAGLDSMSWDDVVGSLVEAGKFSHRDATTITSSAVVAYCTEHAGEYQP